MSVQWIFSYVMSLKMYLLPTTSQQIESFFFFKCSNLWRASFQNKKKFSIEDEDFINFFSFHPSPLFSLFGCSVDLLYPKSQQGTWETTKTQTFLRASRPPNMDTCQNWLVAEQKHKHSGGLAKHPTTIWRGYVTVISATKKVLFAVGISFLHYLWERKRERERERAH